MQPKRLVKNNFDKQLQLQIKLKNIICQTLPDSHTFPLSFSFKIIRRKTIKAEHVFAELFNCQSQYQATETQVTDGINI